MTRRMVNVLFVTHLFPESGGRRPETLVKYFPKFDVNPIILTSKQLDQTARALLNNRFSNGFTIERTFTLPGDPFRILEKIFKLPRWGNWLHRFIFFPDFWIHWVPGAIIKGLKIIQEKSIDVIFTTSPPESIHLVGYWLHKLTDLPWVADFQDLWTQKKINYHPLTPLHHHMARRIEKAILEQSTVVIANTPGNVPFYTEQLGIPDDKVFINTCGFDPEDNPEGAVPPETDPQKLVFGYLGFFDKPGFPYLEALEIFNDLRIAGIPIELQIIGYVSDKARNIIQDKGYSTFVKYTPQLPNYIAIPRLQKQCDLLLLLLYETSYSPAIAPLKLYSYLIMHRRILAIAPETGEVYKILKDTGLGKVFSRTARENIKAFIRQAYQEKIEKGIVPVHPNHKAIDRYNSIKITKAMAKIIKGLANGIPKS